MSFDFGHVLPVRFPFTNPLASKQRPAVVVSRRHYNDTKPDVALMPITSQLHAAAHLGEVWVAEWQAANLLKPSAVKPLFATLEQGLALRKLGSLGAIDQAQLRSAIAEVLG